MPQILYILQEMNDISFQNILPKQRIKTTKLKI